MDDNSDKNVARSQLIAVVLVTVILVAWFKFFMPSPQPQPQQPSQQTTAQESRTPADDELERPDTVPPVPSQKAREAAAELGLADIPEITDPTAEEVTLSGANLELTFTRIGARLKQAYAIVGEGEHNHVPLVPESMAPDTEALYPLGLDFPVSGSFGDALNTQRFDVEPDPAGMSVTFRLQAGETVIRKRFSLSEKAFVLNVSVEIENLGPEPLNMGLDQTPAFFLRWEPNFDTILPKDKNAKQELLWYTESGLESLATTKLKPQDGRVFSQAIVKPEWLGVKSHYFLTALHPAFEGGHGRVNGHPEAFRLQVSAPPFTVEPGATETRVFDVYLGPVVQGALAEAWPTLPAALRFFTWPFMDWFAKILLVILNFFYDHVIANYGLAIIFLTIVVRLAMYPLTLKSMKSMKKMQMLGPEIEKLKAEIGENPQEMQKRMMELYKERGVNPVGGCLPMLLQMPVFIALYRMLWTTYELRGAPFMFWMTDLAQPDHLMHLPWVKTIPFLGAFLTPTFEYLNVLPILMGIAMVLNSKLMPTPAAAQNPQQKAMMTIMPVFFSFICYNMASGLNLYILTSTVLGMVQQKFTRVSDVELQEKKKVPAKKMHFYAAAQQRKRQMEKDAKKLKKDKRGKS